MKRVLHVLLWVWQLPQHLLGLLLIKMLKAEERASEGIVWYYFEQRGWFSGSISGMSLGMYIIIPQRNDYSFTVPHEGGHSRQSEFLGPLYLIIVGIYSAVFCNLWDRWFHKSWCNYDRVYWYYKTRWTERWADKLGVIDRDAYLVNCSRPADARFPAVAQV